jgi:hypothetical protein
MKLTAVFFCLILTILSQDTEAQVDDIEYNLWEQIYDFKIENNRYFFMGKPSAKCILPLQDYCFIAAGSSSSSLLAG